MNFGIHAFLFLLKLYYNISKLTKCCIRLTLFTFCFLFITKNIHKNILQTKGKTENMFINNISIYNIVTFNLCVNNSYIMTDRLYRMKIRWQSNDYYIEVHISTKKKYEKCFEIQNLWSQNKQTRMVLSLKYKKGVCEKTKAVKNWLS